MSGLDVFKASQLAKIVMDEPWDTALMWSDAESDLKSVGADERDQLLQRVVIELSDEGLAYFYPIENFAPGYDDVPDVGAVLGREDLIAAVGSNRASAVPQLAVRPTPRGRERHFAAHPEDYSRWQRSSRMT